MKIQKKLSMLIAASLLATLSWAAPKKVVASTSWSAAFADIAGADEVESIAPVNLRHPPEYEITVSDTITTCISKFLEFIPDFID